MHWILLPLGLFTIGIERKCEGGGGILVNKMSNKHLGIVLVTCVFTTFTVVVLRYVTGKLEGTS